MTTFWQVFSFLQGALGTESVTLDGDLLVLVVGLVSKPRPENSTPTAASIRILRIA